MIFDATRVDEFMRERSYFNNNIKKYKKMVVGGVNQVGVVFKTAGNLTWVKYPDGWEVPVPKKYLIKFWIGASPFASPFTYLYTEKDTFYCSV